MSGSLVTSVLEVCREGPAAGPVESFLKLAVESIDEAIIVTSPDLDDPGPRIEYVNTGFTRMTGYEAHEVIGRTPRVLQGPNTSRTLLDEMNAALLRGQPTRGEAANYRKDGTEYIVEWLITPAHGPDGRIEHWISIQHDITKRKRLEATLYAKEERLGSIVESARDYAIFVTDQQDNIVDWWPGAAAVYGWSAEQALGCQAAMTFTAADREAGVPEHEIAIATRDGIAPNVRWHLHADGHKVFIEGSVRALWAQDRSLVGFLKIGQDVTARNMADKQLRDSEARLTRAVSAARMSTWEWDTASNTLHFSEGMEALYGRPDGSLSSVAAILEAIHPEDRSATATAIERALRGNIGSDLVVDYRVLLPGGQTRWLLMTGKADRDADDAPTRMAGVMQDITERHEAEARIAYMARHDDLTGLANRSTLQEQLANALLRSRRGEACAVLALDLDDFKGVNDTLGHAAGDAVLRSVAARLRESVREVDVVARTGGDEFVIIQSGLQQAHDAETLAARLIAALDRPHGIGGKAVSTGVSIGIALVSEGGSEAGQVLRNADLALYDAKQRNGRCYRFFEPEMQARMENRRRMEFDLRQAVVRDEFELHYQPLVELVQQKIIGFEALVRWRHPSRGLVLPDEFIPLAEETGLIEPLGAWILARACADAVRWPAPLRVAVNLSARQFSKGGLPETVASALKEAGLEPGRLEVEITERLLLKDTEDNLATLHQLHEQGLSISMDDFGTGFSSLSYFAKFPFDRMKIDRSFVATAQEKHGAAIIRAVVDLCGSLDIAVIAEGIETPEQLRQVMSLGCTVGQGFLFGRPCPASDVARLLGHWNDAGFVS